MKFKKEFEMLNRTKKLLSLLIAAVMLLSLCACGGEKEPDGTSAPEQSSQGTGADADGIAPENESFASADALKQTEPSENLAQTLAEQSTKVNSATQSASVSEKGFMWPVPGSTDVSKQYSSELKYISIAAPFGTKVVAAADGTVTETGKNDYDSPFVKVDFGNGYVFTYSTLVSSLKTGDKVRQGDELGFIGKYGTGPHLSLEVKKDGTEINPLTVIKP